jgi:hypothetical protein
MKKHVDGTRSLLYIVHFSVVPASSQQLVSGMLLSTRSLHFGGIEGTIAAASRVGWDSPTCLARRGLVIVGLTRGRVFYSSPPFGQR